MRRGTPSLLWPGLVVALLAAGCASAPPIDPPAVGTPVPDRWTASPTPEGAPRSEWWEDFGDPGLPPVILTALEQNRDLRAAAARLDQAVAEARIAGAALEPAAQLAFNAARRRQNFIGLPIPGREGGVLSSDSTTIGVSLDVSWEADLWGRLRGGQRAALADLQRSAADLDAAHLSIAGQTAKAWFAIAEARQQLALAETTVESFRASTEQVRRRFSQGLRPSLDLRLSLANLAGAEALVHQRRQQVDAATRQLQVLLGRYPGTGLALPTTLPDTPPPVPAGLPSDLVARRPDLTAAERQLVAADLRLGVARADLYPRLSLTGSGGTSSRELKDLVSPDFGVWSLVSSLVQPLIQGGRLRAAVDRAEARAVEAVAGYERAVLSAYAEVETALAAEELLSEREAQLAEAAEQSAAAERLAQDRYRTGLEEVVTVLESQRRMLQAQGELITTRRVRLDNRVDLHLALGGGFEASRLPGAGPPPTDPIPTTASENGR